MNDETLLDGFQRVGSFDEKYGWTACEAHEIIEGRKAGKVLLVDVSQTYDPGLVAFLLAEARTDGVVRYIGTIREAGRSYIVLQHPRALFRLGKNGIKDSERVHDAFVRGLKALEHLHSKRILHRGLLKGGLYEDRNGQLQILVSRESCFHQSRGLKSPRLKMTPTERRDQSVGEKADIFDLATRLIETAIGRVPLGVEDVPSDWPEEVQIVIKNCLRPVNQRPTAAEALQMILQEREHRRHAERIELVTVKQKHETESALVRKLETQLQKYQRRIMLVAATGFILFCASSALDNYMIHQISGVLHVQVNNIDKGIIWKETGVSKEISMTKQEITVGQYKACVDAGECKPTELRSKKCNEHREASSDLPMNCVTKSEAARFCQVIGGRLPSQAEWQQESSTVKLITNSAANFGQTTVVGCSMSLEGRSKANLCDMYGNVEEIVEEGLSCGGNYTTNPHHLSQSNPLCRELSGPSKLMGFRCAKDT